MRNGRIFRHVRGRIGYAPNLGASHWLFYATGGLAWSYDQFTRTQLAGTPAGGTAVPGLIENVFMMPRRGGGRRRRTRARLELDGAAAISVHRLRQPQRHVSGGRAALHVGSQRQRTAFGLNYRLNGDPTRDIRHARPPVPEFDNFAVHGQTTFLSQYVFPFRNPYCGQNSLAPNQGRETWDATAFLGMRLWHGAEFWVNPEIDQGFGLSSDGRRRRISQRRGVQGRRRGALRAYPRALSSARPSISAATRRKVDAAANQFSGSQTANRLVITIGKFSVTDVFDTNKYAHDPRSDFMNWTIADTGTFDYAADAWAYTYGTAVEWYQGQWTLRGGVFDLSTTPNSSALDTTFQQFQWDGEIERRYELWGQPGKLAVTGFLTRGRMGSYADAIALAAATGAPADTTTVRRYNSRGGLSLNLEQQITEELGVFARAGFANGNIEPYEFTDVDRTAAAGVSLNGKQWGRPDDTFGFAGVINGITREHQQFFNDGGLGILVATANCRTLGRKRSSRPITSCRCRTSS